MKNQIGFMQGRLSAKVDGKIQAFPWLSWKNEFHLAEKNGFSIFEWTIDHDNLYKNPLMTVEGQAEIQDLCQSHGVFIPSLTGDCFMQAPFWKVHGSKRSALKEDFRCIVEACSAVGISTIVVALVDGGSLETLLQEDLLINFLKDHSEFLSRNNLRIACECDFNPTEMARFMGRLDNNLFGVNYDIGNSAALGFNPAEEFAIYGNKIINVHVKDRPLNGTTVPLGQGNADFEFVFSALADINFSGNFILQTARAEDDDHAGVLCSYRDMVESWIS
jgi:L-ribulose-5-phosphate 3-epimerase